MFYQAVQGWNVKWSDIIYVITFGYIWYDVIGRSSLKEKKVLSYWIIPVFAGYAVLCSLSSTYEPTKNFTMITFTCIVICYFPFQRIDIIFSFVLVKYILCLTVLKIISIVYRVCCFVQPFVSCMWTKIFAIISFNYIVICCFAIHYYRIYLIQSRFGWIISLIIIVKKIVCIVQS